MLLFSTSLEMDPSFVPEDFLELVVRWNQEMTHRENVIPGLSAEALLEGRCGDASVWMEALECHSASILAVRYHKEEALGRIWDTDYIMNFAEGKMVIRLERSFSEEAEVFLADFSTPYFIASLIDAGVVKPDGVLEISKSPKVIDASCIHWITDVINGEAIYALPVVYVSRAYFDEDPLDVDLLAHRLKGIAHVMVQEDPSTNRLLREDTNGRNEYFGAVGIYFPHQLLPHVRFLKQGYDAKALLDTIVRHVLSYCNHKAVEERYTWQGVLVLAMDEASRRQSEERAGMERETEEWIALLEEQNAVLQHQKERLQRELSETTQDLEMERAQASALRYKLEQIEAVPLLVGGVEAEYLPNETREWVLCILADWLFCQPNEKRRGTHLIRDVLDNNPRSKLLERKRDELKGLLRAADGIDKHLRRRLLAMGFEIEEEGKHYKLIYHGDERYTYSLAKTPSDRRAGLNNASELCKLIF